MIIHSIPFTAKANDGCRAICMAHDLGILPFWTDKRPVPAKSAFLNLRLTQIALAIHKTGFGIHMAPAAHLDTNQIFPVKQPSPRNKKSRVPPAKQLEIWNAAEAKRARKQEKNLLDAGISISEGF